MNFGETTQRARQQYRCDRCGHIIAEGDVYERYIFMPIRGLLHVLRSHVNPDCPPPEDLDECGHDYSEEPVQLAA